MGKGGTQEGGGETTDETGIKGSEAEVAPESQDVNDAFRTGGVNARTGASVGASPGVDTVDKISLMPDSGHGATISCRAVPSRGRDNVAAEVIPCSVIATAPGDAYVGRELVRAGKAGEVAAGA